jgi:hypothetical protein
LDQPAEEKGQLLRRSNPIEPPKERAADADPDIELLLKGAADEGGETSPKPAGQPVDRPNAVGALTLGGVCFTAKGVFEGSVSRPTTAAPWARVEHLRLRYGFRARHPLLLGLFGLVLVGLGIVPILRALAWAAEGGTYILNEVFMVVWLLLGVGALYQALRRGFVLEVKTTTGCQSFEFTKGVSAQELGAFLDHVEQTFGYAIERPTTPGQ